MSLTIMEIRHRGTSPLRPPTEPHLPSAPGAAARIATPGDFDLRSFGSHSTDRNE